jgi:outer membrane immunogenic protein
MTCPSVSAAGNGSRPLARLRPRMLSACGAALLLTALAAEQASAADWLDDTLRGSYTSSGPVRWDGIYFGGQLGVANSNADFSNATGEFVRYSLRETALGREIQPNTWSVLPSQLAHGRSYGGFVGYNMQWDQLVLSGEIAYNRASGMDPSAADAIRRVVSPSVGTDTVTVGGAASIKLNDYGTARARAGYAMGQFLGYGFVGVAVGRFDYSRDLFLTVTGADHVFETLTDSKKNAIVAGWTTGLGVDVAVTPNVFVRGEWEFNAFTSVGGIKFSTNTARVGVGMRF